MSKVYLLIKSKDTDIHSRLKKLTKTNRQNKYVSICSDDKFNDIQYFLEKNNNSLQICSATYDGNGFTGIKNESWIKPNINDDKYLEYLRYRKRRLYGRSKGN